MTDRFNALTVVLEQDIREDDAQAIIAAISQLRGVASVEGNVADMHSHIAKEQALHELRGKMMDIIFPKK
jgi:inosine-uridine nucleoside N-ribohydrolase